MIRLQFRPIDQWPGGKINPRPAPFRTSYGRTLNLLERELDMLRARNVVLQVALDEKDIRLDGQPRARARASHPGVILAFDSKYGPLKYATAEFTTWDDNLRAIALGLEALRKVDRYGITKRGEQYTGWKQLAAGPSMDEETARAVINHHGGSIRAALMATHPDRGGDADEFQRVQDARRVLEGAR